MKTVLRNRVARIRAACLTLFAVAVAAESAIAQSPADSAWLAGDTRMAGDLYEARLATDSTDDLALHRLALMRAWDARYDESLELFGHLLRMSPDNYEARVDRAKVMAWSGDLRGAIDEVDRVLEAEPSFVPAIEARARYQAWRGDLTSAITMQNEVLGVAPEDRDAWRSQATYLVWDDRLGDAIAIYDSLLQSDPEDRASRLGKAKALAWSNRLEEASAQYTELLEADSTDVEAWSGYARVAAWGGRLIEAEDRWRSAVSLAPDDASVHAGLGQTLRWQGRDAASYEALTRAVELAPGNREASDELRSLRLDLSPRGKPGILFTNDSDQNDVFTVEGDASWHPTRSIEVSAAAYYREARFGGAGTLQRSAGGVLFGATTELEPGWDVTGRIGVSGSDGTGGTKGRFEARVRSPRRNTVVGSLDLSTGPLDESAVLIENGVTVDLLQLGARARPSSGWRIDGSASVARFDGSESNRRLAGSLFVGRAVSRAWNLGLFARAFGFEKQLSDGYFAPDLYWITEATATWSSGVANWRFSVDAAPGMQQVSAGGQVSATIRAGGRVAYSLGAGREVSLTTLYSTTGLNSFATGSENYRYLAVGLQLTWATY
ncbi:MAG: tetratricopeptide repeat protein [Gemmatimonadetes bacterium]|nr:tetratricopeptide repeat protein [Gemmatimonadota bacterium]